VQETFVKFWENRKKVRPETLKTLLYTIATNLIKNEFKHNQVVYKFERNIQQPQLSEGADHKLLSDEFNNKLQKALAQIPENARIVFLMNRIEGLTYSEIAARLGLSVKAIEKRMSEAIAVLRSKIEFKI
jgi:RNA polymerase sigma factor (sigma-70 family)